MPLPIVYFLLFPAAFSHKYWDELKGIAPYLICSPTSHLTDYYTVYEDSFNPRRGQMRMWKIIRLEKGIWHYDPRKQLGKTGGFGAVFLGKSAAGDEIAVKRLNISANEAAHREMTIAQELAGKEHTHVIPILDSGLDAEEGIEYFVVMAKAERSLQKEVDSRRFDSMETAAVLLQIALGLEEASTIVHRDLKPDNVLFHKDQWKIADFGIARFAEDSTSLNTVKGCLTQVYAAPEQFEETHATAATDIYALGCIGYALLTGKPPFTVNVRHNCLHTIPQTINSIDSRLNSLLTQMLRKTPEARITRDRVIRSLTDIKNTRTSENSVNLSALAEIAANDQIKKAEKEADALAQKTRSVQRERLAQDGIASLKLIVDEMFERIRAQAPGINCNNYIVSLGSGSLRIKFRRDAVPENAFRNSKWNVVSAASICVASEGQARCQRSASLWYGNNILKEDSDYRWFECAYMHHPLMMSMGGNEPFDLLEKIADADAAAAPGMGTLQYGQEPNVIAIDHEDAEAFITRWINRFSDACKGTMHRPRTLPTTI